jgi:hypothetical protein
MACASSSSMTTPTSWKPSSGCSRTTAPR